MGENDRLLALEKSIRLRTVSLCERYGIGDMPSSNEPIYHYTTAAGLKGILEQKVLWATHSDYLNDVSELRYGRSLIAETIFGETGGEYAFDFDFAIDGDDVKFRENADEDVKRITKNLLRSIAHQAKEDDPVAHYITSFCKTDNLLSTTPQRKGDELTVCADFGDYCGRRAI